MIRKIDHVGIAVKRLEQRLPFWAEALGLDVGGIETVASERVKVAFLPAGPSRVELLEATEEDSPIARHIAKRGEGIHHLTFQVSRLDESLKRIQQHGIEVLGGGPRDGAEGTRVAFLHPRSTGGVLVELVERHEADEPAEWTGIEPASPVLVYLREPQEKLWGVLQRLDVAGVQLEGIDLASFDDWVAQIERGEESVVGPSLIFVPMGRVEKLLLDRSSGHLPSLAERFARRVGRRVQDVIREHRHHDGAD